MHKELAHSSHLGFRSTHSFYYAFCSGDRGCNTRASNHTPHLTMESVQRQWSRPSTEYNHDCPVTRSGVAVEPTSKPGVHGRGPGVAKTRQKDQGKHALRIAHPRQENARTVYSLFGADPIPSWLLASIGQVILSLCFFSKEVPLTTNPSSPWMTRELPPTKREKRHQR